MMLFKLKNLLLIVDLIITVLSYFLAYFLINLFDESYFVFSIDYVYMLVLVIFTWVILIKSSSLSQSPRIRSYLSIFFSFLNISLVGFVMMFVYKHVLGLKLYSHYFIIAFSLINLVLLFLFRLFSYRFLRHFRTTGHNIHNLIIIADNESEDFINRILNHKEWGYRLVFIISNSEKIKSKFGKTIKVLPEKANIKNLLDIDIIDEVIYCKSDVDFQELKTLVDACHEIGVIFRLKAESSPMTASNAYLTRIENSMFLTFINTPNNSMSWAWKSVTDFIIAFGLLLMLSPVFLVIAVIIKTTSKGPAIFKQKRVGLRGRQFYIYKFRTMVQNAEEIKEQLSHLNESDGPTFKIKHDPRITFIGRILRKTSIDELPQLFNVLKGEMSIIGPRPALPSEVEKYKRWQLKRLSVKPGITCTWQIIPNRNDVLFEKWMKLDIQYIENWSFKSDVRLFFKTISTVFSFHGY